MHVLVLGGTRFIGPYVVRGLRDLGHDVTLFHRGRTEQEPLPHVRHIHGEFSEFETYVPELRKLAPDVVLDMVPLTEEEGNRVLAFKGVARRAVVISSADVYRAFGRLLRTEPGEPEPLPLTEQSPLREKLSPRGLEYNKTAMERVAKSDPELPVTILRLPATYGPGDYMHRLFFYIKRMDDARPTILVETPIAQWRWARGYVEDVATAVLLAVSEDKAAGKIYNVAELRAFSEAEWIEKIAKVTGWKGNIVTVESEQLPETTRNTADLRQDFVIDSDLIRRELGYAEVVDHTEALRRTIEWERANPPEIKPGDFNYALEDQVLKSLRVSFP